MKDYELLIEKPVITEKSTRLRENNKYVFKVHESLNKIEIKRAVETVFNVHVRKVNVMNMPGRKKRLRTREYGYTSSWKKAIVTLAEGDTFEFFEA